MKNQRQMPVTQIRTNLMNSPGHGDPGGILHRSAFRIVPRD
jgi:hypothetical protein